MHAASLAVIGGIAMVSCGVGSTSGTEQPTVQPPTTHQSQPDTEVTTASPEAPTASGSVTAGELNAVEAIVDKLFVAFVAADSDTAAAFFTEDGVWVDKNRGEWIGRSEITAYVKAVGPGISRCERTGSVEVTDEGSLVFPVEFTWRNIDYRDVAVVTMGDDLILRLDWHPQP